MNKVAYLKEPGILYDMLFALKLRFNGERAYMQMRTVNLSFEEDEVFYNKIINKLSDISENLLSLFYYDGEHDIKTAIFTYLYQYIDYTSDNLIEQFYDSLRNIERLKKTVYKNYISQDVPESLDRLGAAAIKDVVFSSVLPDRVKMYLYDFLLFGEEQIEDIITEFRKVEKFCRVYHEQHDREIREYVENFGTDQVQIINEKLSVDLNQYELINITFCVFISELICIKSFGENIVSMVGIRTAKILLFDSSNVFINLYALGNILNDEQRLKILDMLAEEEMYCAEIARRLGLKNNSTLYHLTMMEKEGLLIADKKKPNSRRIYYIINRDYLNAVKKLIDIKYMGDAKHETK